MNTQDDKPRYWARFKEGGAGWTYWQEISEDRYNRTPENWEFQKIITYGNQEPSP